MVKIAVLLATIVCAVASLPLDNVELDKVLPPVESEDRPAPAHSVQRRFINPLFSLGTPNSDDIAKIRTKRSEEECEKLQLCKLHAQSRRSFFAAYELYFVNKENAQLWDHRGRSIAECEHKFSGCYYK